MTNPTPAPPQAGGHSAKRSRLRNLSRWLKRLRPIRFISRHFSTDPALEEAKWVAAAVARCETILAHYQQEALQHKEGLAAPESAPALPSDDISRRLSDLMKEDRHLRRFISRAGENDPQHALVLAKAEVNKLETLRKLGWSPAPDFFKTVGKLLVVPGILITLTALLGNYVGNSLQEAAFQRNRTFEYKLAQLKESQNDASDWFNRAQTLYYDISADEVSRRAERGRLERAQVPQATRGEIGAESLQSYDEETIRSQVPYIENLQKLLTDLDKLSGPREVIDSEGSDGKEIIGSSEEAARNELLKSLECFQKKRVEWNNLCSDQFQLKPLERYKASFGKATLSLLQKK